MSRDHLCGGHAEGVIVPRRRPAHRRPARRPARRRLAHHRPARHRPHPVSRRGPSSKPRFWSTRTHSTSALSRRGCSKSSTCPHPSTSSTSTTSPASRPRPSISRGLTWHCDCASARSSARHPTRLRRRRRPRSAPRRAARTRLAPSGSTWALRVKTCTPTSTVATLAATLAASTKCPACRRKHLRSCLPARRRRLCLRRTPHPSLRALRLRRRRRVRSLAPSPTPPSSPATTSGTFPATTSFSKHATVRDAVLCRSRRESHSGAASSTSLRRCEPKPLSFT